MDVLWNKLGTVDLGLLLRKIMPNYIQKKVQTTTKNSLYWIKKFGSLSFSDLVDILYDRRLLKDWTLFIIGACSGSFKLKKKTEITIFLHV